MIKQHIYPINYFQSIELKKIIECINQTARVREIFKTKSCYKQFCIGCFPSLTSDLFSCVRYKFIMRMQSNENY